MDKKSPRKKILVIKLGALGDFIQALGPMAAIRKHHPEARITLLTTAPFKDFAIESGYCDEILIDRRPRFLDIKGWAMLKKMLNGAEFSRVYDLQNNNRTSLYFRLLSAKNKPEWVGVAEGASHRNTSPARTAGPAFDGHVQTLALAGVGDVEIDKLEWIKADISAFPLEKPYVLLVPGSAPNHPQKRWPAQNYAQLANFLVGRGYQPVLLGTEAEQDVTAAIKAACRLALDLTGRTSLAQIVALARGAAAAIGNDTGPMHLIAPTGCRVLGLFSKRSTPQRHAPLGKHVETLQKDDLKTLDTGEVLTRFESMVSKAGAGAA